MSYNINSSVETKSGLSVAQLDSLVAGTGLANLGASFLACEQNYNINALFVLAHAALESAWGNSYIAQRNNLFGLNAVDSNPNAAWAYPSKAACVDYYGHFMRANYLSPGGFAYNGDTLHDIFVKYSTSHDQEANSIAGIMNACAAKVGAGTPAGNPTPSQTPAAAGKYVVASGDTLSGIASRYKVSLQEIELWNPQINNPDKIFPGEVLNVGGTVTQTVQPASGNVHVVQSGETLSGIAQANGLSLSRIEQLNPQISNPNVIHPGDKINLAGAAPQPAPAAAPRYHTVASGETLSGIAQANAIGLVTIEQMNPQISNPDKIYPGQNVRVK